LSRGKQDIFTFSAKGHSTFVLPFECAEEIIFINAYPFLVRLFYFLQVKACEVRRRILIAFIIANSNTCFIRTLWIIRNVEYIGQKNNRDEIPVRAKFVALIRMFLMSDILRDVGHPKKSCPLFSCQL